MGYCFVLTSINWASNKYLLILDHVGIKCCSYLKTLLVGMSVSPNLGIGIFAVLKYTYLYKYLNNLPTINKCNLWGLTVENDSRK